MNYIAYFTEPTSVFSLLRSYSYSSDIYSNLQVIYSYLQIFDEGW